MWEARPNEYPANLVTRLIKTRFGPDAKMNGLK